MTISGFVWLAFAPSGYCGSGRKLCIWCINSCRLQCRKGNDAFCFLLQASAHANEEKRWVMSDFEVGKPLGRGKFGHVYLAREKRVNKMLKLSYVYLAL
jgi:hypothetical protein